MKIWLFYFCFWLFACDRPIRDLFFLFALIFNILHIVLSGNLSEDNVKWKMTWKCTDKNRKKKQTTFGQNEQIINLEKAIFKKKKKIYLVIFFVLQFLFLFGFIFIFLFFFFQKYKMRFILVINFLVVTFNARG